MIRVEIIGNIELLDELTEKLLEKTPQQYYSIMPLMRGFGKKGYASGDTVWPESNFYCLILINDSNANVSASDNVSANASANANASASVNDNASANENTNNDHTNNEYNNSQVQIFKEICDDIQKNAPQNSITIFATKTISLL